MLIGDPVPVWDPVERRIEFPTFPCYFLLLGQ